MDEQERARLHAETLLAMRRSYLQIIAAIEEELHLARTLSPSQQTRQEHQRNRGELAR